RIGGGRYMGLTVGLKRTRLGCHGAGHAIPHSVDRVRGPSTSRRQTESSASYRAVCNLGDGIGIEHRGIYSFIEAHLARLQKFFGLKWHRPTTRSTSFSIS